MQSIGRVFLTAAACSLFPCCHAARAGGSVGQADRPVAKVVALLKGMQAKLEKEAEEDEQIYDKMSCWCTTNEREKDKSIAVAKDKIELLTGVTEDDSGKNGRLGVEIQDAEQELAKNKKAIDDATALRDKQLADFNAEEKDLLESIAAVKQALTVLAKHHGGASLIQVPRGSIQSIAATLKTQLQKHEGLLQELFTHSERKVIRSFLQTSNSAGAAQSYAPQSGEIFGILQQMKENFEANLADAQKEEAANQKAFEELRQAKEEEIAAGQAMFDTKSKELAASELSFADAQQEIALTKESLSADEAFLASLKEKCSMTDAEWETRQKTRRDELAAISKALAFVSSEEAHALFGKTFSSFLQRGALAQSARRERASAFLSAMGRKIGSPRLSVLAVQTRLDAFTRVKKAIDGMIAELLQQKKDEIAHRDWCVTDLNQNQVDTTAKENQKADILASIQRLEESIKTLTASIEQVNAEIKELNVQLKRAGEDRERANQEFHVILTDQRDTEQLLTETVRVLREFYDTRGPGVALAQNADSAGPAPPEGFKEYKVQDTSVIGMLEGIIGDTQAMQKETTRDEEDAQKAYEDFVIESNTSLEAKARELTNLQEQKAQAEKQLDDANRAKDDVLQELEILANLNAQLHKSCDYIMKNFDLRQTARDQEVEALRQAKAILSGAKFNDS